MSKTEEIKSLASEFYPYAKQQLGFDQDCKVKFINNCKNASDPLGKTAYYDPSTKVITVFITNRHSKDILRSFAHELVHHAQNCAGKFKGEIKTEQGYAQNNKYLRELEKEAYLKGNLVLRDFEDSKKDRKNETIYSREKNQMRKEHKFLNHWKDRMFAGRHERLMGKLFESQGVNVKFQEAYEEDDIIIDLGGLFSNEELEVISQYYDGQGDPLYQIVSNNNIRKSDIDGAIVNLERNAEDPIQDRGDEELSLIDSVLYKLRQLENGVAPDQIVEKHVMGEPEAPEPEILKGGLADDLPDSDFDLDQLKKGMEVEKEHTNNPEVAEEIAKDHLKEDPKYYDKLAKMEAEPKEEAMMDNEENPLDTPEDKNPIHVVSPEEKAIRRHDDKLRKLPQHKFDQIKEIVSDFVAKNEDLIKKGKITKKEIVESVLAGIKK